MKFIIKIEDIEIEAENLNEAQDIAIDVVNDIGGDGNYTIVKKEEN